jgi:hypothetical protein
MHQYRLLDVCVNRGLDPELVAAFCVMMADSMAAAEPGPSATEPLRTHR